MVRNIDGRLPERCWQRFGSTHLNVENVDGGLPGPRRGAVSIWDMKGVL
jgi:hypothetical protein